MALSRRIPVGVHVRIQSNVRTVVHMINHVDAIVLIHGLVSIVRHVSTQTITACEMHHWIVVFVSAIVSPIMYVTTVVSVMPVVVVNVLLVVFVIIVQG